MSTLEDAWSHEFLFFSQRLFLAKQHHLSFFGIFSECLSMCTVGMCSVFSNTDMKKGFKVFPSSSIFQFPDTQLISQKNHFLHSSRPPLVHPSEGCSARLRKEMLRDGGRGDFKVTWWNDMVVVCHGRYGAGDVMFFLNIHDQILTWSRVYNMMITLLFHTKHDILLFFWHNEYPPGN